MTELGEPPPLSLLDEPPDAGEGKRPSAQLPEPSRFWIRYVPRPRPLERHWPAPPVPWLDLSRGRLHGLESLAGEGASEEPPPLPAPLPDPLDDVLYLPPVAPRRAAGRDALAARHASHGTPVLLQVVAGDALEGSPPGTHVVVDLTAALLTGDHDLLDRVPAGGTAAWPLLPAITDDPSLWESACARLAAAGARAVQGVVPELTPADKRHLLERFGDDLFDALFHRDPPQVRDLARVAHGHGLAPFLERPLPRRPMLGIGNRRLAGWITLAAELEDRLERFSPQRVQGLYRAAREADRTPYDLEALARDGNLGVLGWLTPEARRIVEEALEAETPRRIRVLLEEYVQ